jgi:hypothetical protein
MVIKNKFTDHKVLLCFFVHPMDFWQSNDNGSGSVDGICRLPNEVDSDLFSRRILPSTELILSEWVP